MKKRFTEEQIVSILRETESGNKSVAELARHHGVSEPTIYGWKRKYGGMEQAEVRRLKDLEKENARLKRLLAERDVEIDVIKEYLKKSRQCPCPPRSGGIHGKAGRLPPEGLRAPGLKPALA